VTAELRYAFLFWRWRHSRKPAIKYHATLAATTTPRKRRTGLDRTPAISGEFSSWLVGTGFMREGRKMRLLIDGSMGTLLLVGPELKVVVMRTTVRVSAGLFLDPPQLFQPFPGSAFIRRVLPSRAPASSLQTKYHCFCDSRHLFVSAWCPPKVLCLDPPIQHTDQNEADGNPTTSEGPVTARDYGVSKRSESRRLKDGDACRS